jgi:hypothetical protein
MLCAIGQPKLDATKQFSCVAMPDMKALERQAAALAAAHSELVAIVGVV